MRVDYKEIVEGYLRHFRTKSEDDSWAVDKVDEICRGDACAALEISLALIEACQSDGQLAYVAAGPLEDLMCRDAGAYALLDKECKRSHRFLRAVHLTYMDETDESYPRWRKLLHDNSLDTSSEA